MRQLIILLGLFINLPAYALVRGTDIYPMCEHVQDKANPADFKNGNIVEISMKRGFLIGYCMGVVGTSFQAIRGIGYVWNVDSNFARCMENYYGFADINGNQILDMTIKYLKNNPKYRNLEINVVMAAMFHDYYPESVCLKNKR